jgi:hypothetical protein
MILKFEILVTTVGVVTRLLARQLGILGRFFAGKRGLTFPQSAQASYGAQPTFCSVGTGDAFTWVMWPVGKVDHVPLLITELRNVGTIPPFPHMHSWRVQEQHAQYSSLFSELQ